MRVPRFYLTEILREKCAVSASGRLHTAQQFRICSQNFTLSFLLFFSSEDKMKSFFAELNPVSWIIVCLSNLSDRSISHSLNETHSFLILPEHTYTASIPFICSNFFSVSPSIPLFLSSRQSCYFQNCYTRIWSDLFFYFLHLAIASNPSFEKRSLTMKGFFITPFNAFIVLILVSFYPLKSRNPYSAHRIRITI